MSYGLSRKIRVVFIVQALLVTLVVIIGAWLLSTVARHALYQQLLREDAVYFWDRYAQDPATQLPDTRRVRGLLVPPPQIGQPGSTGIAPLHLLPPGYHDRDAAEIGGQWLVLVDDGPGGCL